MDNNKQIDHLDGTKGLKKVKMRPIQVAFLLYCLVAAGAFGIEDMIPTSGPGFTILILILFAIIWAHPISKDVSELSALMPSEGGVYIWVKEALGEFWGFCTGWWAAICIYLCIAAYVVLITDYASAFIPALNDPVINFAVKFAIVAFFIIINILGLKEMSWVNTLLSVIILAAFAFVTIVGFANWNYNPVVPFTPEGASPVDCIGGSIAIAVWMYCGYECISNMGGEIANPEVIPKGFKIVMPIIALSYILPTLAGLVSIGNWQEWGTDGLGFGDVLGECLGYGWGVGFMVIAIIGQAAIFNSYIAAGSRGFFVLADDNLCPKFLVKVNKRGGVPVFAILLIGITTVVMMNFDFEILLIICCPLTLMIYVVMGISMIIIRKRFPVEDRDCWYIKGSKIKVYIYALLPVVIAIIAMLVNGTEYFLLGFVAIVSALVFYIIFKPIYGGLHKMDQDRFPINPKTKLAKGDLLRIGIFLLIFGAYAFLGSLFLAWYEGAWGAEYYLDLYGSGIMSDFWLMIKIAKTGGIIAFVLGIIIVFIGKKKDNSRWFGTGDFE